VAQASEPLRASHRAQPDTQAQQQARWAQALLEMAVARLVVL
jgi:hypothetical protein